MGIRGGKGRVRAEPRTLLVYVARRPTLCNVSLISQTCPKESIMQLTHPKVASSLLLGPFVAYSYAHACRNIFNTIKTSGHSSFEKYTSHFIERVVCERELETEQRLQHIDPPTLLAITAFLSRSPGLLNRGLGAQPLLRHGSHSSIFSPTHLNFLSPGLYNNLTSTYFLRAS